MTCSSIRHATSSGDDPDSNEYRSTYDARSRHVPDEDLVLTKLALQWRVPSQRPAILQLTEEYGVEADADLLDTYAARTYTMTVREW